MFLFSGVLAPLVHPHSVPGWEGGPGLGAPALPPVVARILGQTGRTLGAPPLRGGTSYLLDRHHRGFMAVQTHLGCLVANGDPVFHGPGSETLVRDFVSLARSGGRVPVVRNARAEYLDLYRTHGLVHHLAGREGVVRISSLRPGTVVRSRLDTILKEAERAGVSTELVPHPWVASLLPELREVAADIDEAAVRTSSATVVRVRGRVVAFALLRAGVPGGEVRVERLRCREGAPGTAGAVLMARLAVWARDGGHDRILLGTTSRKGSSPFAAAPGMESVLSGLPTGVEARYTVRPAGWKGAWARLAVQGLAEAGAFPA